MQNFVGTSQNQVVAVPLTYLPAISPVIYQNLATKEPWVFTARPGEWTRMDNILYPAGTRLIAGAGATIIYTVEGNIINCSNESSNGGRILYKDP